MVVLVVGRLLGRPCTGGVLVSNGLACPDSGKRMTVSVHTVTVCCPTCGRWVRLRKDRRMVRHAPGEGAAERQARAVDAIKEWKRSRGEG